MYLCPLPPTLGGGEPWVPGPRRPDRGEWSACPSTWGPIMSSVRSTCPVGPPVSGLAPPLGRNSGPWCKKGQKPTTSEGLRGWHRCGLVGEGGGRGLRWPGAPGQRVSVTRLPGPGRGCREEVRARQPGAESRAVRPWLKAPVLGQPGAFGLTAACDQVLSEFASQSPTLEGGAVPGSGSFF